MSNDKRYLGQTSTTWRKAANRLAVLVAAPIALAAVGHAQAEPATTDAAPTPTAATAVSSSAGLGAGIGCWTEWKTDGTSEALYGDQALAPAGSTPLDCEAFAEPADSSDESAGPAQEMIADEWQCLYDLGYPDTEEAVWVSDADKAHCRQMAASQASSAPADAAPAGAVAEDSPGFDCRTNGNRTCGPDNADGVAPGCYVDGQLAEPWVPEMYGQWTNCGPVNAYDSAQQARLDGKVGQVCLPNEQGGFTCDWADAAPEATVQAEDGTSVPVSFYDRTDYNRDGVVDQEQGFGPNPNPAEVMAK